MEHLSETHLYFSSKNIVSLVGQIDGRVAKETEEPFELEVDQKLLSAMIKAALDRPEWLMTANTQEGVDRLNDLVTRRVLRNLTTDTDGAEYGVSYIADQRQRPQVYSGGGLYKMSRQDKDVEDPKQTHAGYMFGANIFKKHNEKYQAEMRKARQAYSNDPLDAQFDMTKPSYLRNEQRRG